ALVGRRIAQPPPRCPADVRVLREFGAFGHQRLSRDHAPAAHVRRAQYQSAALDPRRGAQLAGVDHHTLAEPDVRPDPRLRLELDMDGRAAPDAEPWANHDAVLVAAQYRARLQHGW